MITPEVAGIGQRLIQISPAWGCFAFKLEHNDSTIAKHNSISSPRLAREFIFEEKSEILRICARPQSPRQFPL
jgi:hypothetical protein